MSTYRFSHEYHPKKTEFFESSLGHFDRLMKDNGIPFFISEGTALGYYRENQPIPWDNDIDVCVFNRDYDEEDFDNSFLNKSPLYRTGCGFEIYKKKIDDVVHGYLFHCHIPNQVECAVDVSAVPAPNLAPPEYLNEPKVYSSMIDIYIAYDDKSEDDLYYIMEELRQNNLHTYKRRIRGIKDMKCGNAIYKAPSNIEEYLEGCYGENFMTPIEFDKAGREFGKGEPK